MKKYKLIMLLIFFNIGVGAQDVHLIKSVPQYSQGWLVLQNSPGIKYWDISIIQRLYDGQGNYEEKELKSFSLIGENYTKIPVEFKKIPNCFVYVTAYFEDGSHPIEEVPIGSFVPDFGTDYESEPSASWTCNGTTYAYTINQYVNDCACKSYFTVDHACQYGLPYYQWFDSYVFLNNVHLNNNVYYTPQGYPVSFGSYHNLTSLTVDYVNVTKVINNGQYFDAYNSPIGSTWVYGVKKTLGPWGGYSGNSACLQKNDLLYGSVINPNSILHAIQIINGNNPPLSNCDMPQLTCVDAYGPVWYPGEPNEDLIPDTDWTTLHDTIFNFMDIFNEFENNWDDWPIIFKPDNPIIGIGLA